MAFACSFKMVHVAKVDLSLPLDGRIVYLVYNHTIYLWRASSHDNQQVFKVLVRIFPKDVQFQYWLKITICSM